MEIVISLISIAISIGLIWAIFDIRKSVETIKNEIIKLNNRQEEKDNKWV